MIQVTVRKTPKIESPSQNFEIRLGNGQKIEHKSRRLLCFNEIYELGQKKI